MFQKKSLNYKIFIFYINIKNFYKKIYKNLKIILKIIKKNNKKK